MVASRPPQRRNFIKRNFSRARAFSEPSSCARLRAVPIPEGAMKFVGLSISIILLVATSVLGQTPAVQAPSETSASSSPSSPSFPTKPNALTICAGNVPPENMVITGTGTSFTCSGSCRSRQIEPAEGPIMVICAGQPIPQYYETESVTSSPACNCLGDQDNAYVIRRLNTAPTPTPSQSPISQEGAASVVPNR